MSLWENESPDEAALLWERLGSAINEFRRTIRDSPVVHPVEYLQVQKELDRYDFRQPVPLDQLTTDIVRLFRDYSLQVTHPRYFGLFNPGVRNSGIIAETLAATFNPQLSIWSHSPIATQIEEHVLRQFSARLGFPAKETAANFTTGGAESNLTALVVALNQHFPNWQTEGLIGLKFRPRIYLSTEGHDSFLKAVRICGLGDSAIQRLQVNPPKFSINPDELKELLITDRSKGWYPLMIVGTAGTTSTGAVDPLRSLAMIAKEQGAWFHVDAAWGGAAVMSPKLQGALSGSELADSVTWDAHKWLSVPLSAGMFFCRHRKTVQSAFSTRASYMPAQSAETVDMYTTTVQWSRRTLGLKVFMALAELGFDGYRKLIEHQAEMGDYLRGCLKDSGFEIVNETSLPVVCFTHPAIKQGKLSTKDILRSIYSNGQVWISDVTPSGRGGVLRACITHYKTDKQDVNYLVKELYKATRVSERNNRNTLGE